MDGIMQALIDSCNQEEGGSSPICWLAGDDQERRQSFFVARIFVWNWWSLWEWL